MAEQPLCPTLRAMCIATLCRSTSRLGDLGWLEAADAVAILQYCESPEDLAAVEDATLAGSGRELTWYTWHIWAKIYASKYGPPPATADLQLGPLPGEPPLDYAAPAARWAQGDWRGLYEAKTSDIAARMAALRGRLRGSYAAEELAKAAASARATDKLPPAKRGRGGGGGGGGAGGSGRGGGGPKIMGKSKAVVMKDLLGRPWGSGSGGGSGGGGGGAVAAGQGRGVLLHARPQHNAPASPRAPPPAPPRAQQQPQQPARRTLPPSQDSQAQQRLRQQIEVRRAELQRLEQAERRLAAQQGQQGQTARPRPPELAAPPQRQPAKPQVQPSRKRPAEPHRAPPASSPAPKAARVDGRDAAGAGGPAALGLLDSAVSLSPRAPPPTPTHDRGRHGQGSAGAAAGAGAQQHGGGRGGAMLLDRPVSLQRGK